MTPEADGPPPLNFDPALLKVPPKKVWQGFAFFGVGGAIGINWFVPGVLAFAFQGWILAKGGLRRNFWWPRVIVANAISIFGSIPLLIRWPAPSLVGIPLALVIAGVYALGPLAEPAETSPTP